MNKSIRFALTYCSLTWHGVAEIYQRSPIKCQISFTPMSVCRKSVCA